MSESKSHDGEDLHQAFDRFSDNLEDPFDRHRNSRGRYGWADTLAGHSLVNVFVTACRERPRSAGHWWAYQSIASVVLLLIVAVLLLWVP